MAMRLRTIYGTCIHATGVARIFVWGATRPIPPGRCHPVDATRPMPPGRCHPADATRPMPPGRCHPADATRPMPPDRCHPADATRPMPPGRCHPADATRPMPPGRCHQALHTFEALAGIWGSVSVPAVSRITSKEPVCPRVELILKIIIILLIIFLGFSKK